MGDRVHSVRVLALCGLGLLAGCRRDTDEAPPPPQPPSFSVGGIVSGLTGTVTLANNGGDSRTVSADGAFVFATPLSVGGVYDVTVATQPADQTCTVANGGGTVSSNVSAVTVTCVTYRVSATLGAAGGTVTHPDGAQVIIPAGALSQPTVISISRPATGWPTPLLEDMTPLGAVYELTPHDTVFARPVRIRLPYSPTTDTPGVMVNAFGQGWELAHVLPVGSFIEFERNTFSWYIATGYLCAGRPPNNCSRILYGAAYPTAMPGNALAMISGSNSMTGNTNSVAGSAGTYDVDLDSIQSLDVTLLYKVPDNCGRTRVIVTRVSPKPKLIQEIDGLRSGAGSATVSLPVGELTDVPNVFAARTRCTLPNGNESGGGDWITFNGRRGALSGFTVGGTVTGLSMSGLQLQAGLRGIIDVPANASTFDFGTLTADGLPYEVIVRRQPTGGGCVVTNATGTISGANVTDVAVACRPLASSNLGYAVVTNENTVSANLIGRDENRTLRLLDTKPAGSVPSSALVSRNGLFVYVGNQAQNSLSSYRIDTVADQLAPIPSGTVATVNPSALAMDADGRFLFAANNTTSTGSGGLSLFRADNNTGLLTPVSSVGTGRLPAAVALDPTGRFVYTANEGSSDISIFQVNPSSPSLTSIGTLPNAVSGPKAMVVESLGKFAYVLGVRGNLARFAINQTTGELTSLGFTTINGASSCTSLALQPDGGWLYASCASSSGSTLQAFAIASDGSLASGPVTVLPTTSVASLAIGSSRLDLFVAMKAINQVSLYSINQSTGELTLRSSVTSPGGPSAIASTP